jgi:hypothetical protein
VAHSGCVTHWSLVVVGAEYAGGREAGLAHGLEGAIGLGVERRAAPTDPMPAPPRPGPGFFLHQCLA